MQHLPCTLLSAVSLGFFHVSLLAAGSSCLKTALKTSPKAPPVFLWPSSCQRWLSIPFGELSFGQQEPCRPAQAVGTSGWGEAEAGATSPTGPSSLENVFNGNWSLGEKVLKWWPRIWNNLLIGKWRVSACIFEQGFNNLFYTSGGFSCIGKYATSGPNAHINWKYKLMHILFHCIIKSHRDIG